MSNIDYNLYDLGFSKLLTRERLVADSLEAPPEAEHIFTSGVSPSSFTGGSLSADIEHEGGVLYSGKISFSDDTAGYRLGRDDDGLTKFLIGNSNNSLFWNGSSLAIKGTVTASSIHIPDQDTTANSFHVNSNGDAWWGATETNFNADNTNAKAYVLKTGVARFADVTLTNSVTLGGLTNTSDIGIQGWTHDITFSVTDADTVSWGSGTITLVSGKTFSIAAGNTGNMTTTTYIYLDKGVSETVLQTTTTASTAVGANKILIAVAKNSTSQALFQVFGGKGGVKFTGVDIETSSITGTQIGSNTISAANIVANTITASEIAANTITANEIATGTITANEISAGTITANEIAAGTITANEIAANTITASEIAAATITGTEISSLNITSKTITADTGTIGGWTLSGNDLSSGSVKISATNEQMLFGSATAPLTGVGVFLGKDGTDYEFRAGDPSGDYMHWDGSTLTINGYVAETEGTFGGDGSDGALSVSSGTTQIDLGNAKTVVKNYSSISITGTGNIEFINPHSSGTIIYLKSNGDVTITSSASVALDASGMGAAAGVGGTSSSQTGSNGTAGSSFIIEPDYGDGAGGAASPGAGGAAPSFVIYSSLSNVMQKYPGMFIGSGGGGGYSGAGPGNTGGAGGRGGGCLIIECGGALNFGASSTISVAGKNGSTGGTGDSAGGGGGGGGFFLCLYNTLTANSGTVTISGGTGGNNGSGVANNTSGGGGGAGKQAGSTGTTSNSPDVKTGGNGGSGFSLIAQNTEYS